MSTPRVTQSLIIRWQKVVNPSLVKGPWTKEEDEQVRDLVKKYGPKRWSMIAKHLNGRIGKQCRERYVKNTLLKVTFIKQILVLLLFLVHLWSPLQTCSTVFSFGPTILNLTWFLLQVAQPSESGDKQESLVWRRGQEDSRSPPETRKQMGRDR